MARGRRRPRSCPERRDGRPGPGAGRGCDQDAGHQDAGHQDAGQLSLVGTASLDWCREHLGVDADRRRLRPNLVVDTSEAFVEERWSGVLAVGTARLRVVRRVERCRMIDIAQEGLPPAGRWLTSLSDSRQMCLAVYLEVVEPGTIRVGDEVRVG
ncbi:MAG: MOSC domain-containing protein [Nocardioides sp.]